MRSAPDSVVSRSGVLSRRATRASGPVRLRLLIVGLVLLAAFGVTAALAASNPYFPFDVPLERWIQASLSGVAPWFFSSVTALNGTTQTLAGIVLLLLVVVLNPRAILFAVLASLTGPIYFYLNATVNRPRPSPDLVRVTEHLGGSSFPSGHATFAATYVTLLVLCVGGKYLKGRGVTIAAAVGAVVVIAFSVARIVTGGHWPSDVLGGLLLTAGWMSTLLSIRFIGDPVLRWFGDPEGAWNARHPSLPYGWESRRRIVRRALYTPSAQAFERFGFVVRGLLWGLMGAFAIAAVFKWSKAIDLYGAVAVLEANAFRAPLAFLATVGLAGYALWGWFRAIGDPLQRGNDVNGIIARAGCLSSAVSYTLLALFAAQVGFAGPAAAEHSASQAIVVATLVAAFEGVGLVFVISAFLIVVGLGQLLDAWRAPFRKDVLTPDAPRGRAWVTWIWLGRTGLLARGVLFLLSGGLILAAGITGAKWSLSFAKVFESLLDFPAGAILLTLLGLGLVALGLHSFGGARWIRMRPPVLANRPQEDRA
jgi:membrane-associated phospholipid phosphatase